MVSGICDPIRHLDTAKANLSKSIKTLSNLQLYIRNIHNLGAAIEAKEWSSVNSALRLAQDYRAKFKPFEETPKVKELSDKLSTYEREIEFRLCSVVISELLSDGRNDEVLREACLVVDALGPEVVARFRQKFIVQVMEPYNTLFRRGSEEASVERTERRFTFIRQILEKRRSLFLNVFPASWTVAQELCVEFCLKTNKEVGAQLREEVGTIEVAALVYILPTWTAARLMKVQRAKSYVVSTQKLCDSPHATCTRTASRTCSTSSRTPSSLNIGPPCCTAPKANYQTSPLASSTSTARPSRTRSSRFPMK